MSLRLGLALAAVALLAVAALLVAAGRDQEAPPLRPKALSAEGLVDSIGVNVHFSYLDTAYARQPEVLQRLAELGVRHVRDAMAHDVDALRTGLSGARDQGLRGTLIADPAKEPGPAVADSVAVMGGGIEAFEGPNELDNSGDPAWPATLGRYMPELAAAVRGQAPDTALIGPSFVNPDSRSQLPGDLPGLFNGHPYPGGGPPEPALGEALRGAGGPATDRGVVFTETGYHNALAATTGQPPTSEEAAAVYLPRLLVTAFGAGVERTFVYELLDEKPDPGLLDPEQHFGLLRQDLSAKPAFTAIKTLIAAVRASPGGGSERRARGAREPSGSRRLAWSLEGEGGEPIERLLLRRRDGSWLIALWRPAAVWDQDARQPVAVSPLPLVLSLETLARDVEVWRPSVSSEPVLRRPAARRIPLELEGDLVLVSLR